VHYGADLEDNLCHQHLLCHLSDPIDSLAKAKQAADTVIRNLSAVIDWIEVAVRDVREQDQE
jgi:hypothetical protein